MSERLSLEQLKAMDDKSLFAVWVSGAFPFEYLTGCGCLTMHGTLGCRSHAALVDEVRQLGFVGPIKTNTELVAVIRPHLEELYALRLFYDHLYPQPEAQADQLEALRENEYDSRANTR